MKTPVSTWITAAIAISSGVIVLLGYFIPALSDLQNMLLQIAVILAAFAFLVGVFNLLNVHIRKFETGQSGSVYSAFLLLTFILTVVLVAWNGPTGFWSLWAFNNIQVPIETSLLAVMAVVLAFASARLFYRRQNLFAVIFAVTAFIVLLAMSPGLPIPGIEWLRNAITQTLAVAGARGILLGVALGTVAAGIRILMGIDRPYGG
jgi:hypothetical protein